MRPRGHPVITHRGNYWTTRYPLVVEAMNHLKVRSCLIDGEVVWSATCVAFGSALAAASA